MAEATAEKKFIATRDTRRKQLKSVRINNTLIEAKAWFRDRMRPVARSGSPNAWDLTTTITWWDQILQYGRNNSWVASKAAAAASPCPAKPGRAPR